MSKKNNHNIVRRYTTKQVKGHFTEDHPRYHELVNQIIDAQLAMSPITDEIEKRKKMLKPLNECIDKAMAELCTGNIQTIDIVQTINFLTRKVMEHRKDNGELLLERDMDETDAQGRTGDAPSDIDEPTVYDNEQAAEDAK
jgi:hypothetical protein